MDRRLQGSGPPLIVEIRRWAAQTLSAVAQEHLADVVLVVTELVTNAYEHGRGPRQPRMSHTLAPCRVRIEIDDSSAHHPAVTQLAISGCGGRGMQLVDTLAECWGVYDQPRHGGKTVWAEIRCDGAYQRPCRPHEASLNGATPTWSPGK